MPPLPGEEDDPSDGPIRRHLPGTVTQAQLRKIGAQFTDLGFKASERADKLALASRITGRELTTTGDLSVQEASQLIDFIDQHAVDYPAVKAALDARDGGSDA